MNELRTLLPQPELPNHPDWVAMYWRAWQLGFQNVRHGNERNGFDEAYMDAAFSENIFQWDTCCMVLFARYAWQHLPIEPALDNFYNKQEEDGWICREYRGVNGAPLFAKGSADAINPPLFAWAEWELYRITGARERLAQVLPHLVAYDRWLDAHQRGPEGLYWSSAYGCGMDNTPRFAARWADMCMQQVLSKRHIARIAQAVGDAAVHDEYQAATQQLLEAIDQHLWVPEAGVYWDVDGLLEPWPVWTAAPFWALLADVGGEEQKQRLAAHLHDPNRFWRPHPFPTLAADHPAYNPDGGYWQGGVWAPTNYVLIRGLREQGFRDLAREAAIRHLDNLAAVLRDTGTLWENYAPERAAPGQPARGDFVGWTGLGPIANLIEDIIGVEVDASAGRIVWHVWETGPIALRNLRFGANTVDLTSEGLAEEGIRLRVRADHPVTLEVHTASTTHVQEVAAGEHTMVVA